MIINQNGMLKESSSVLCNPMITAVATGPFLESS